MARLLIAALLLASACGRVRFDPLVDGDGSVIGNEGNGGEMTAQGCAGMPACPGFTIPIFKGQTGASSSPSTHDLAGSCAGSGNPEAVWKLDPQVSATYTISVTVGGPAAIVVRDGCCMGPELACKFDAPVTLQRAQGQQLYVFIESLSQSVSVQVDGI